MATAIKPPIRVAPKTRVSINVDNKGSDTSKKAMVKGPFGSKQAGIGGGGKKVSPKRG